MSTAREIAEELGLSPSTVAAVLRGKGHERQIALATQQRIEDAAKRVGYQPNAIASSLRAGRSNTVGIIGHSIPEYHILRTREAARHLIDAGYRVAMQDLAWRPERETEALAELFGLRIEGLFIESGAGAFDQTDEAHRILSEQARRKFPMVRLDISKSLPVDVVGVNREEGVFQATCHLLRLGHRYIAFAIDRDSPSPLIQERIAGFVRAHREWGVRLSKSHFFPINAPAYRDRHAEYLSGYQVAQCAIQHSRRPTALLGSNDYVAMGAVAAALKMGMRVPDDLSVVGCVGYPETSCGAIPLTTIAYPFAAMARVAARMLLERMGGFTGKLRSEVLLPELMLRQSCGGNTGYQPLDESAPFTELAVTGEQTGGAAKGFATSS